MKKIFVITEDNEVITARDSMNNAIVAAMNRIAFAAICANDLTMTNP